MKAKIKLFSAITIILTFIFIGIPNYCNNSSALEYQTSADINFTINPSITLSLSSSDLIIDELVPNTGQDSNSIVVNILTNNAAGYTLTANVGSSDYPTSGAYNLNDLIHTNLTNKFVSLSTSDSLSSVTDFNPGTWGYSYSINNGASWSNYSGLPAYTTASTTLREKYIPADDDIGFKIAARADSVQASGTYTNKINFTAVGNIEMKYYMQNFTNSMCQALASDNDYTVYDYRDNNDYTVRYINGACWMTQNLRITHTEGQPEGTILGEGSNFNAESITFDGNLTQGNSYTEAYYHLPTDSDLEVTDLTAVEIGAYYNFCATSAKDIANHGCDDLAVYTGTEDICPANWNLPTYITPPGNFSDMTGKVTLDGSNNASLLRPIMGGYYNDGALSYAGTTGILWSSTKTNYNISARVLYNQNDNLIVGGCDKSIGSHIRCVRTD